MSKQRVIRGTMRFSQMGAAGACLFVCGPLVQAVALNQIFNSYYARDGWVLVSALSAIAIAASIPMMLAGREITYRRVDATDVVGDGTSDKPWEREAAPSRRVGL